MNGHNRSKLHRSQRCRVKRMPDGCHNALPSTPAPSWDNRDQRITTRVLEGKWRHDGRCLRGAPAFRRHCCATALPSIGDSEALRVSLDDGVHDRFDNLSYHHPRAQSPERLAAPLFHISRPRVQCDILLIVPLFLPGSGGDGPQPEETARFSVIVLGSSGGVYETGLSAYLLQPMNRKQWV